MSVETGTARVQTQQLANVIGSQSKPLSPGNSISRTAVVKASGDLLYRTVVFSSEARKCSVKTSFATLHMLLMAAVAG